MTTELRDEGLSGRAGGSDGFELIADAEVANVELFANDPVPAEGNAVNAGMLLVDVCYDFPRHIPAELLPPTAPLPARSQGFGGETCAIEQL